MSSFTITNSPSGTMYNSDEFLREVIPLAQLLAKNARLEVPFGQDTDLSEAESKETQRQVRVFITSRLYNHIIFVDPRVECIASLRSVRLLERVRRVPPPPTVLLHPLPLPLDSTPCPLYTHPNPLPPPFPRYRALLPPFHHLPTLPWHRDPSRRCLYPRHRLAKTEWPGTYMCPHNQSSRLGGRHPKLRRESTHLPRPSRPAR